MIHEDDVLTGEQMRVFRTKLRMFRWFIDNYDEIPEWLRDQMRIGGLYAKTDEHLLVLRDMYHDFVASHGTG